MTPSSRPRLQRSKRRSQNGFLSIRFTLSTNELPFFFSGVGEAFGFSVGLGEGDGEGVKVISMETRLAKRPAFVFVVALRRNVSGA